MALYTDALLLMGAEPSDLSIVIYDFNWGNKCSQKFVKGLYPGYFIGQLQCTAQSSTAPEQLDFIVVYQNLTVLTSDKLSV